MELSFVKMQGLGNDFIAIDDRAETLDLSPEAVEWFCDRNFGIGADGLMLVRPATLPEADFAWWFRNADGSIAEMCGNGIRCFAKFVVDRGLVPADQSTVLVETAIGVLSIDVTRAADGTLSLATVDMGEPILSPELIPSTLVACGDRADSVVSCPLITAEGTVHVTLVSMGNPHCVTFVDDVEDAPVHTLGPVVETDDSFPNKTNVEFVEVVDRGRVRLRVWERGVGETLACGTGACATVVASVLNGHVDREVVVELPGGELSIRWADDNHVFMTGPAEEVFSGTLIIEEDESE